MMGVFSLIIKSILTEPLLTFTAPYNPCLNECMEQRLIQYLDDRLTKQDSLLERMYVFMTEEFSKMYVRFEQVDARFEKIDARFEKIETRLDQIDARIEQIETRFDQIDARFEKIHSRFEHVAGSFEQVQKRLGSIEGQLHGFREILDSNERERIVQSLQLDRHVTRLDTHERWLERLKKRTN